MQKSRRPRRNALFTMLLLAGCAQGGMAAVIGVPADVPTIQGAVDVAEPGDEVLVAAGTWNETINLRGKSIVLRGAAGSQATTLNGRGLEGSVIRCVGEEAAEIRIEGFTITMGSGDMDTYGPDSTIGGGLLIVGSSPTIIDCVFRENKATLHGGAVYCGENANATFQNCVFQSNVGEKGGAVFNIRSNPRFSSCTFIRNMADYGGGGVFNDRQCSPTYTRCHFEANEAIYNGGAIYDYESSGSILECSFTRNMAAFKGGAIYVAYRSDSVMANCRFLTQSDDVAGRRGVVANRSMIHGACCLGGNCIIASQADCENAGGAFSGEGSVCDETVTRCTKPIHGDLNKDGEIDKTDMAVLMLLWQ